MTSLQLHGYEDWLKVLKARIRAAQARATFAVNSELVLLYWQIGKEILDRQQQQGWGTKVVERLAEDLRREFPEMKGFSRSNLMYMRAFAEAWPDAAIVQQLVGQLPWGHNLKILSSLKSPDERTWYTKAAIDHGWGRDVLVHQIETRLHERQGSAITNFKQTLPAPQSELAQQLIKDPMIFDFLSLGPEAKERDLEDGLILHVQKFLMELGKGFAFMGRQYHLEVGGQDYFLDLLFYNTHLHSHVVIDLKIDEFKPEYVGKMQFYLAAVDDQVKTGQDGPSIGLILCKTKNGIVAEYALRDTTKPIGVAEYRFAPPGTERSLPSIKQLETELSEALKEEDGNDGGGNIGIKPPARLKPPGRG
jgi:predicted nuclease of restriction endonuclease-like (RecB) superfamily